jgi:hypothetical protein
MAAGSAINPCARRLRIKLAKPELLVFLMV